ncbi:hypothetical protein L6164_012484 [Bauhinia variegata]|uniref:Uncharacterized protein n=1 Tax=Bauhinia variegata TaxID=167791 RepID=A0ACB9P9N6_BAUVA|nr:hypothetical protein L6164_012484 [Bauhinia variegata]
MSLKLLTLIISALAIVEITMAGDPDILTDYVVPQGVSYVDGNFFTYTGFCAILAGQPTAFKVTKASMVEFPALNGQSVSYAALQFPGGSVNPPHTHPRSAELLLVGQGSLQVGFMDTTDKLYTQKLQEGDMFIFPKGLEHYQYNADPKQYALAISAFGSANAGTVSIPSTLFNTSIDDNVLALAFKTNVATIRTLKKSFTY